MGAKIVTVEEMKAIEEEGNQQGTSYAEMMERAGRGVGEAVLDAHSQDGILEILGLVGSGNNGGDTLIALERLANEGYITRAYLIKPRPEGEELVARLEKAGGVVQAAGTDAGSRWLSEYLPSTDILLDGVLGTGARLPLHKELKSLLASVRKYLAAHPGQIEVVAVDCPSGVDCDTGQAAEETLPADRTICMAAVKIGLLKLPAFSLCGEIQVVDIGLPEDLSCWKKIRHEMADLATVRGMLPDRPIDAHKGTFGTAMILAGSINYTGAALLAGKAAHRSGAGLVTMAIPSVLHTALAGHFPEATWVLLPHEMGVFNAAAADVLHENLARPTAMLLGPGWGTNEPTYHFLLSLLSTHGAKKKGGLGFFPGSSTDQDKSASHLPPLVIDADGLKLLSRVENWPELLPEDSILTPHPGEMSGLTGLTTQEIQADRTEIARKYAKEWQHVVVLKGAFTVVASPDGAVMTVPVATPALARAGTGDVLAGIITGLRAQKMSAFEAATAGAWIHAQCGLAAYEKLGSLAAVLAGDVLDAIPDVLKYLDL